MKITQGRLRALISDILKEGSEEEPPGPGPGEWENVDWPGPPEWEGSRHWSKKDKNIRRIGAVDFEATKGVSGLIVKIGDRGDKGSFILRNGDDRDSLVDWLNALELSDKGEDEARMDLGYKGDYS